MEAGAGSIYGCPDSRSRSRSPFVRDLEAVERHYNQHGYHMDHSGRFFKMPREDPSQEMHFGKRQPFCACPTCNVQRQPEYASANKTFGGCPEVSTDSGHWSGAVQEQWCYQSRGYMGKGFGEGPSSGMQGVQSPCSFSIRTPLRGENDTLYNVADRDSLSSPPSVSRMCIGRKCSPQSSSLGGSSLDLLRQYGPRCPSAENQIILHKWFLIRDHQEDASISMHVAVGGFLRYGIQDSEFVRTGTIVDRLDKSKLRTRDGVDVRLMGCMNEQATVANGFSVWIAQLFLTGFPVTWKRALEDDSVVSKMKRKVNSLDTKILGDNGVAPQVAAEFRSRAVDVAFKESPNNSCSLPAVQGFCPKTPVTPLPGNPEVVSSPIVREHNSETRNQDSEGCREALDPLKARDGPDDTCGKREGKVVNDSRKEVTLRDTQVVAVEQVVDVEGTDKDNITEGQNDVNAAVEGQLSLGTPEQVVNNSRKRSNKRAPSRYSKRLRKEDAVTRGQESDGSNEGPKQTSNPLIAVVVAETIDRTDENQDCDVNAASFLGGHVELDADQCPEIITQLDADQCPEIITQLDADQCPEIITQLDADQCPEIVTQLDADQCPEIVTQQQDDRPADRRKRSRSRPPTSRTRRRKERKRKQEVPDEQPSIHEEEPKASDPLEQLSDDQLDSNLFKEQVPAAQSKRISHRTKRSALPPPLPAPRVTKSEVIQAYGLKTSRSGRLLVPPLAYWRNQTLAHDKDGGIIAIFDGFQERPSDTGYFTFKPPTEKKALKLQEKLCAAAAESPVVKQSSRDKGKKKVQGTK